MRITQRNGNDKLATLTIIIVVHLDGSMMQLYQRARQVKSDSRSHLTARHRQLIESFEYPMYLVFWYTLSIIINGDARMSIIMSDTNANSSSRWRKLKRIRENVNNHLVEITFVNPNGQSISIVLIVELHVLHLRLLRKQSMNIAHEANEVSLAHSHLHLTFVYLSEIHHLVNQSQYSLCVSTNGFIESPALRVVVLLHQLEQRSHNQRHRSTYLMTDVHEEAKFCICQFLGMNMFLQTHTILFLLAKIAQESIDT